MTIVKTILTMQMIQALVRKHKKYIHSRGISVEWPCVFSFSWILLGMNVPAKKILMTYLGKEYNESAPAYRNHMELWNVRHDQVKSHQRLKKLQHYLEKSYTPYLDSFNVTGKVNKIFLSHPSYCSNIWCYHCCR